VRHGLTSFGIFSYRIIFGSGFGQECTWFVYLLCSFSIAQPHLSVRNLAKILRAMCDDCPGLNVLYFRFDSVLSNKTTPLTHLLHSLLITFLFIHVSLRLLSRLKGSRQWHGHGCWPSPQIRSLKSLKKYAIQFRDRPTQYTW